MLRRRGLVGAVLAVGLLVGGRFTVFDTTRVSSGSMAPTLCQGDVVVIDHVLASRAGVGDIVTFPRPGDGAEMVKRVVATAGQRVAIADAVLEVDGVAVPEPYVDLATIDGVYFGPVTVPPGTVFVMGDDREVSIDSRAFGPVAVDSLDGQLLLRLFSACPAPRPRSEEPR